MSWRMALSLVLLTALAQPLAIARQQQAKGWELRAAVSVARLRARRGRPSEARDRLAEVLGWFTEGFDTADVREAKALLTNLG